MSRGKILAIAATILLTGLPVAFHAFAQEDAIGQRKAIMKTNNDDVKAIGKAAENKDYATIELKAKEIMTGLERVTTFFPPGSTSEKSRAHPDIWVKFDDFKNHASAARKTAEALAKAAAAKNDAEINVKVKELGNNRDGTCGACHQLYRTDFRKGS